MENNTRPCYVVMVKLKWGHSPACVFLDEGLAEEYAHERQFDTDKNNAGLEYYVVETVLELEEGSPGSGPTTAGG